jgi:hypothetical protein
MAARVVARSSGSAGPPAIEEPGSGRRQAWAWPERATDTGAPIQLAQHQRGGAIERHSGTKNANLFSKLPHLRIRGLFDDR